MKVLTIASAIALFGRPIAAFVPVTPSPRHIIPTECILYSTEMDWLLADDVQLEDTKEELLAKIKPMETNKIKADLLDLLPRMMGTDEDFRTVEAYVNTLEERYSPVQTIDFLNLAMAGDWQLLFSTNLAAGPRPDFRLREMYQSIEPNSFEGKVENEVMWDLAENEDLRFDASGTFTVKCKYSINQGARMVLELDDHVINLAKASAVPKDVEGLVGQLHRAMPKELFDPNDHAMDTTYLDTDVRIVRMTGSRFEGVRNIFIRRGSMEVNPLKEG